MASKMLVDHSHPEHDVFYCVPCALKVAELDIGKLSHAVVAGEEICALCECEISKLPDPPVFDMGVNMRIDCLVTLQVSSAAEALSWVRQAFGNQRIEELSWVWNDGEKSIRGVWRL